MRASADALLTGDGRAIARNLKPVGGALRLTNLREVQMGFGRFVCAALRSRRVASDMRPTISSNLSSGSGFPFDFSPDNRPRRFRSSNVAWFKVFEKRAAAPPPSVHFKCNTPL